MDEYIDIELSRPIKIDGVEVKALRMRDIKVKDQIVVSKMKGTDAENEVALMANLCSVTPEEIQQMSMRDYTKLQKAYRDFIG